MQDLGVYSEDDFEVSSFADVTESCTPGFDNDGTHWEAMFDETLSDETNKIGC